MSRWLIECMHGAAREQRRGPILPRSAPISRAVRQSNPSFHIGIVSPYNFDLVIPVTRILLKLSTFQGHIFKPELYLSFLRKEINNHQAHNCSQSHPPFPCFTPPSPSYFTKLPRLPAALISLTRPNYHPNRSNQPSGQNVRKRSSRCKLSRKRWKVQEIYPWRYVELKQTITTPAEGP